jgi:hypothetical protein
MWDGCNVARKARERNFQLTLCGCMFAGGGADFDELYLIGIIFPRNFA